MDSLQDSEKAGRHGSFTSGTSHDSTMAALRESREWLAAVFAASRDAVLLETSGRITQANNAGARLFGYATPEELVGLPLSTLLPEHDAKRMLAAGHSHPTGSAPELFILTSIRHDGLPVQLEASVGAVALDGEPHSVFVLRDVTARASLEAQLRHAQKMEAVGQLANGVAHDFNNLLTAIRCQTETILAYEQITPSTKEMLEQVMEATKRAANLTRQLLAFSRRTPMQQSTVNLNELATNVSGLVKRLIKEDIVLDLQLQDALPPVCADVSMMEQAIVNLAVNARDAMPRGGRLTLSTALRSIDPDHVKRHPAARLGEHVELGVTDTGGGIPPGVLPRVFEPFFTTKEVGQGAGLGLSVAMGIVQQLEGWIEVESVPAEGTRFTMFLPARRDLTMPAPPSPKAATSTIPVGNEPLLLVEDDPQLRKLIRKTLEKFGYRVVEAGTGAEAMALWEKHCKEIRLALVDWSLPEGVNGLKLVEQMRVKRPELRVILMSGYGEETPALKQKPGSGVTLLTKPFDPQSLAGMVRSCCDEKEAAG